MRGWKQKKTYKHTPTVNLKISIRSPVDRAKGQLIIGWSTKGTRQFKLHSIFQYNEAFIDIRGGKKPDEIVWSSIEPSTKNSYTSPGFG